LRNVFYGYGSPISSLRESACRRVRQHLRPNLGIFFKNAAIAARLYGRRERSGQARVIVRALILALALFNAGATIKEACRSLRGEEHNAALRR